MRVGWLVDDAPYVGGAELTQAEFWAAVPEGVKITKYPPGKVRDDCDVYAIHNCVTYTTDDLAIIETRPAFKYHNDVGSWLDRDVRRLLNTHARPICCSPLQAKYMGLDDAALIPPPVDLDRFAQVASSNHRSGAVSVGSWRNIGKASHKVAEWAAVNNTPVDFYGDGPFAHPTSRAVPYADLPAILARYQTFVFLPNVIEPFGRTVAEAWAAGLELVINSLVGAAWWIQNNPKAIETAAADYWKLVLG